MSISDWDWRLAGDRQDYPWDCAACSTAWCLRTIGRDDTEQDVIAYLGPDRITATYGLMDASGAGLVEMLGEIGVSAANNAAASWSDVQAAAGHQPMVIGGRAWGHWVAVRMGSDTVGRPDLALLILMNPASGYMGVEQTLNPYEFDSLGPFSAVWFTAW
jgi:hypothetical protein